MSRYQLGIVPCTKTKNPTAVTARSLYRGGPFSLMMRHAMKHCDHVIIMSAKYGLLELEDPVAYYQAYMPDLTRSEQDALFLKLMAQLPHYEGMDAVSYLPKVYYDAAFEAAPWIVRNWDRPYKTLPMLKLWARLSEELK